VVLISLDLAVVHAIIAQVFFALLITLAVMTSPSWLEREETGDDPARVRLSRLAVITAITVLAQIGLGALLRHPGRGISIPLAVIHMIGAAVVFGLVFAVILNAVRRHKADSRLLMAVHGMSGILLVQIVLGFTAYFVLLNESGVVVPSNLQVITNTLHLVVGALLWGTAVGIAVWARGMPAPERSAASSSEPDTVAAAG
jgi:cytochrome c oxidase assembly protein subunit 15